MAFNDPRILLPFIRLSEVQWKELLKTARLEDDPPPLRMSMSRGAPFGRDLFWDLYMGGRSLDPDLDWIRANASELFPAIFRVTDPTDSDVAILSNEDAFWIREVPANAGADLRLAQRRALIQSESLRITDVCIASSVVCELFVNFAAAHRPLGVELDPPATTVESGSVKFGIDGGLFASGIALLTACAEGLVADPVTGIIGGAGLATAGAINLALSWKQKIAEIDRAEQDRWKTYEETKATRVDTQLKEIEYEMQQLKLEEARRALEPESQSQSTAPASALVPRELVQEVAERVGINEAHANHLLNRVLSSLVELEKLSNMSITVHMR